MITSTATESRYSCDACEATVVAKAGHLPMLSGWLLDPDGQGVLCPGCRRARKPPMHLIPLHALRGAARVMSTGDRKYRPGDYRARDLAEAKRMFLDSMLRHLADVEENELAVDEDSGAPSLDHVISQALIYRVVLQDAGALEADPGPLRVGPVVVAAVEAKDPVA